MEVNSQGRNCRFLSPVYRKDPLEVDSATEAEKTGRSLPTSGDLL